MNVLLDIILIVLLVDLASGFVDWLEQGDGAANGPVSRAHTPD